MSFNSTDCGDILVKFPLHAAVFYSPLHNDPVTIQHPKAIEVEQWCEEVIPNRYYMLYGGDHEYEYQEIDDKFVFDTWADLYIFRDPGAMMLFKLRWGGA